MFDWYFIIVWFQSTDSIFIILNRFFLSVCFTHQILSNKGTQTFFLNIMSANNCLELNFLIQFICYWQYSGYIFLLKFNSSQHFTEFEWSLHEFEYGIGILSRVLLRFSSVSFFKILTHFLCCKHEASSNFS